MLDPVFLKKLKNKRHVVHLLFFLKKKSDRRRQFIYHNLENYEGVNRLVVRHLFFLVEFSQRRSSLHHTLQDDSRRRSNSSHRRSHRYQGYNCSFPVL